jgi:hypothetical protein
VLADISPQLLDERSRPSFRNLFGRLLSESTRLDTALLRIRLRAVDLSALEMKRLEQLRILVGGIDAGSLEWEAQALAQDSTRSNFIQRLVALLADDRLDVRAAPLAGWAPDFSIFSHREGPRALLLGPHWFQKPFAHRGPAWGCLFGPREAALARARFEENWAGAHDIGPAVSALLDRACEGTIDTRKSPVTQGLD